MKPRFKKINAVIWPANISVGLSSFTHLSIRIFYNLCHISLLGMFYSCLYCLPSQEWWWLLPMDWSPGNFIEAFNLKWDTKKTPLVRPSKQVVRVVVCLCVCAYWVGEWGVSLLWDVGSWSKDRVTQLPCPSSEFAHFAAEDPKE